MRALLIAILLVLFGASLHAQTPGGAAPVTYASKLGFSYSAPTNWEVVDTKPIPLAPRPLGQQNAKSDLESRLAECSQTELTLRHASSPPVTVVVTTAPFDCIGRSLSEKDFPRFVLRASRRLTNEYDVSARAFGGYTLGSHDVWIERAKVSPKGHPESPAMVELACSLLKKASVCWMADADEAALKEFEHCAVTLDGESAPALVPASAAAKLQKQEPSPTQRPDSAWNEIQAAPAGNAALLKSALGFTYSYPADWDDFTAVLPLRIIKQQKAWGTSLLGFKLGCLRPVLLVQRGAPLSSILVFAAPHSCTEWQESAFLFAAPLGGCTNDSSSYDINDTQQAAYKQGGATLFIERSVGTPKGQPNVNVTLERVCGWLNNSEVYWQGELRDEEAVRVFEGALTSMNGEPPFPLVPASAKAKLRKPFSAPLSIHPPKPK